MDINKLIKPIIFAHKKIEKIHKSLKIFSYRVCLF